MRKIKIKIYKQTGKRKDVHLDRMLPATIPGWRTSKSGNRYFEARKNRSDARGKKI
jgi:hypothetical protein